MNRVTNRLGITVAQGRNLAVVMRYNRVSPVTTIRVDPGDKGTHVVTFYFADGCRCRTVWQSCFVFLVWLMERRAVVADRLNLCNVEVHGNHNPVLARIRRKGTFVHGLLTQYQA